MHLYERLQLQQSSRMTFKTFFVYLEKYRRKVEFEMLNYMNNLTKALTNHIISSLDIRYNIKKTNPINPYFNEGNHGRLVLVEASISDEKLKSSILIPPYKVAAFNEDYNDSIIHFDVIHIESSDKVLFSVNPFFIEGAAVVGKGLKDVFIRLARNTIVKIYTDLLVRFSIVKSVNTLDIEVWCATESNFENKSFNSATFDPRVFYVKINNNCELELSMAKTKRPQPPNFELYVSDKQLMRVDIYQKDYNQLMYNYFYRLFSNLK